MVHFSEDDMMKQEKESLVDRVVELERKLQEQEDEVVLLRSSMADVLRRLSHLEQQTTARPQTGESGCSSSRPLLPRYMSKSSSNLIRTASPNATNSPSNDAQGQIIRSCSNRRPVSPSPRRIGSVSALHHLHNQNGGGAPAMDSQASYNQQQRRSPTRYRQNGCGGPILSCNRKSAEHSTANNISNNDNVSEQLSSSNNVIPMSSPVSPPVNHADLLTPPGRFGSMSNISLFGSLRSVVHNFRCAREAVYSQEEGCLKIHLCGKSISLHAPTSVMPHNGVDVYHQQQHQPAPKEKLKLEWVYGYRGRDCRSNIHCLPTGEMVYFIANIVVLYNAEEQMQRHYLGHTDEVKCLSLHPNRLIVASGQSCNKQCGIRDRRSSSRSEMESVSEEGENLAHVRIWDSVSLKTLHVIGIGDFERSISCLAFSKTDGGGLLAVVDESHDHLLSIWDWQRKQRITETKSSIEPVLACEFHPTEKNNLITCGKGHLSFWKFDGNILQRKPGLFEGREKAPKYILCLAFTETGHVLCGDSNGNISMWNCGTAKITKQASKAHDGGVFTLLALKNGRLISGGGKDGKLMEWDSELKSMPKQRIELPVEVGPIRTVANSRGDMLIVGTTHNCILRGTMQFGFNVIMQGHADDVWGLCAHPIQQHFLTCGYDKTLRMWDSQTKRVLWKKEIADLARCCAYNPPGDQLVIGTTIGRWLVIDTNTRDVISAGKDGDDIVSCLEYSPDGRYLSIGSHDGGIYVHSISGEDGRRYNRIGRCSAHTGPVTHLDWSSNSEYLRSNSGNLEVLYWRPMVQKLVDNMDQIRDIEWSTKRCPLSFNTAGLWPGEGGDGTEVRACDSNHEQSLVACASGVSGEIRLYQYPCFIPKASSNNVLGHSSTAADVRFLQNDTRLISIGAKDSSILQWEIV